MANTRHVLRFRLLWLMLGYALIAFVVQQTLTASPVTVGVQLSDKFLHTFGYFVLMGWFVQIYHQAAARLIWAVFFVCMGVGLEFLQGMSGVRFYEVNDMLANGLGVVIAWLLSYTRFSRLFLVLETIVVNRLFTKG